MKEYIDRLLIAHVKELYFGLPDNALIQSFRTKQGIGEFYKDSVSSRWFRSNPSLYSDGNYVIRYRSAAVSESQGYFINIIHSLIDKTFTIYYAKVFDESGNVIVNPDSLLHHGKMYTWHEGMEILPVSSLPNSNTTLFDSYYSL